MPETVFPEYESEGTISQVTLLAVELGSKSGQILFGGQTEAQMGSGNMNPSRRKVFLTVSMMSGVSDPDIFSQKKYLSLKMR